MFTWFKKRKRRIMVVEDELDIALSLQARIEMDGFEVMIVGDGNTALDMALEHRPDAIILDVMLPNVNGFEVCRLLKKYPKTLKIPVLILTALPQLQDVERAFNVGASDFLNKPFTNERLMEKLYKILNLPFPSPKRRRS